MAESKSGAEGSRRKDFEQQVNEAIDAYTKALHLNPEDTDTYWRRGTAHIAIDQMEEARQDFEESLRLSKQQGLTRLAANIEEALDRLSREG